MLFNSFKRSSLRSVTAIVIFLLLNIVFSVSQANGVYKEVEWIELIPQDDLEALLNPPDVLFDIADGSQQDSVDNFTEKNFEDEKAQRFQQALRSTRVVETMAEQKIKIPGFIVPLETSDDEKITEYFIVPYFGACLHMPPPPPNQIIFAKSSEGITLTHLSQPFWFEGTLKIEKQENPMGVSAYRLAMNQVTPYED
ncbi:DUF3299 domain-containing protein [Planctobacterium marinum]|uniref:DUF3299 domain-containing protein n=1 Tax=Planctobacterium marinum TaxID=1631968 RepID=UPI001E2DCD70|nr:DUF3299 domain-containing protein [Planctobacterium marinum]MCC2603754.1 DUF3299 domain-containing protein [Planctobacterium marinum]